MSVASHPFQIALAQLRPNSRVASSARIEVDGAMIGMGILTHPAGAVEVEREESRSIRIEVRQLRHADQVPGEDLIGVTLLGRCVSPSQLVGPFVGTRQDTGVYARRSQRCREHVGVSAEVRNVDGPVELPYLPGRLEDSGLVTGPQDVKIGLLVDPCC